MIFVRTDTSEVHSTASGQQQATQDDSLQHLVIRYQRCMLLSDKFTVERGSVYLTGIQALVRLPLDQMRRDRRAGLKTGAFISGYEGSPLGGYDLALARSKKLLDEHGVHFRPGLNEDLAATSVMGTQIFDVA